MVLRIVTSCLVLFVCGSSLARAEEARPAVYQRLSTPATIARANWAIHGGNWGGNWGWGYPGFYNPWFQSQLYGGTWYERPYPDHLIYNNVRSGMPAMPAGCGLVDEAVELQVAPDR